MKNIFRCLATLFASSLALAAAKKIDAAKVQFTGDKVLFWPGGQILTAPKEAALPFDILVQTNGTFTVNRGKPRKLTEGEILDANGMSIKPDGSVTPVMDHVTLNRGKVMVFRDGQFEELRENLTLGDGAVVTPDGKITPRGGSERRLLDGELFQLSGGKLPSHDTLTLQQGRVVVQKDGSKITVDAGRSITMNDGTKVLSDGTVIKPNGDRTTLTEGQIIVLEGVVTRPR